MSREYLTAAYAPPGYLLGVVGSSLGAQSAALVAQPFDTNRLIVTGDPAPIAEHVAYRSHKARSAFSVSANGTLVYGSLSSLLTRLIWFDRSGKPLHDTSAPMVYGSLSLSPDDNTVVVERVDPQTQAEDLWLIDITRDVASRFTSYPNSDIEPVWSPDRARIVFASPRGTPPNLYLKAVAGTGDEELLVKSSFNTLPTDWSRDGRFIVYASLDPHTQWDLWILPMSGGRPEGQSIPLLRTEFNEHMGQISPDGGSIAYVSDESGTNEVYVRTFPGAGARQRVSTNGGRAPKWRADGRELFYLGADGMLMTVTVKPGSAVEVGAPVSLFKTEIAGVGPTDPWGYDRQYTVTRDGQRFLINTVAEPTRSLPMTIVFNWPTALNHR